MEQHQLTYRGDHIKLEQALKLVTNQSGGTVKAMIQDGIVKVNGETETRRGRKLHTGDTIDLGGEIMITLKEE